MALGKKAQNMSKDALQSYETKLLNGHSQFVEKMKDSLLGYLSSVKKTIFMSKFPKVITASSIRGYILNEHKDIVMLGRPATYIRLMSLRTSDTLDDRSDSGRCLNNGHFQNNDQNTLDVPRRLNDTEPKISNLIQTAIFG